MVVTRFYAKDTIEEELCQNMSTSVAPVPNGEQQGNVVDGSAVAGSSRG